MARTIGAMTAIMIGTEKGVAAMSDEEPVETTPVNARPTLDEVAALIKAAVATMPATRRTSGGPRRRP